jgi:hypothetical protein
MTEIVDRSVAHGRFGVGNMVRLAALTLAVGVIGSTDRLRAGELIPAQRIVPGFRLAHVDSPPAAPRTVRPAAVTPSPVLVVPPSKFDPPTAIVPASVSIPMPLASAAYVLPAYNPPTQIAPERIVPITPIAGPRVLPQVQAPVSSSPASGMYHETRWRTWSIGK